MHRIPARHTPKNPLRTIRAGEEKEAEHGVERVPRDSASRRFQAQVAILLPWLQAGNAINWRHYVQPTNTQMPCALP